MMPGFLLHKGAAVSCNHSGQAEPKSSNARVRVSGQSVVTESDSYTVTGCILPDDKPRCESATWVQAATRVRVCGVLVLLEDSQAVCATSGQGLNVNSSQIRARGI